MELWKEKRLDKLIEFGEMIYHYSEEGEYPFIDADESFCRMTGFEKEELFIHCRNSTKELIYPPDIQKTEEQIITQIEKSGEYNCQYRMRRKDGEILWVWESGVLDKDDEGNDIIRAVVVNVSGVEHIKRERDITYNNIPGGIVRLLVTDSSFYIIETNKQYCDMMNISGDDYLGSSGMNTFSEDLPAVGGHIVRQAKTQEPIDYIFRGHQHGDEEIHWYRLVGRHYGETEDGCEYLCILMDVTESQRTLYQLKRQQKRFQLAMGTTASVLFEYNITTDEIQVYGDFSSGKYIPCIEEDAFGVAETLLLKSGFIHPDDCEILDNIPLIETSATEKARFLVKDRETGKMSYQWYEIETSKIWKRQGERWLVGSARTLEEKEEDEANKLELRNIFETQSTKTYETIISIDAKTGKLKGYFSEQFAFQVVYPKDSFEEYIDKMTEEHVHPEDRERFSRSLRLDHMKEILKFNTEEEVLFFRIRKAEAEYHRYKCFRYSYLGDNMNYIIITIQDVHQLREEQMKLEEANRKIMASALEVKQTTMELRRNFSAMIARELKAPLQFVEQSFRRYDKDVEEAEKVQGALAFMRSVINTISEQEKLEQGKVRFDNKQFDLSDMLEELLQGWETRVKKSSCQFNYSLNIRWKNYVGDPGRIVQVLNNIIGNCVRSSLGEGQVNVWVNDEEQGNGSGKLFVMFEDNGIPVTENHFGRLYPMEGEETASAWSSGDTYLSNSMSLLLARQITEQMGGTIHLSRRRERSNVVELEIPLLRSQEGMNQIPIKEKDIAPKEKVDLGSYALLLVEKTSEKEALTAPMLKLHGAQVDIAGTGEEAIKLWKSYPEGTFQGILVVGNMEDMDYLEFAEKFRSLKRESARKIPILVCSSSARQNVADDSLKMGINAMLSSPLDVRRLKRILDALMFGII